MKVRDYIDDNNISLEDFPILYRDFLCRGIRDGGSSNRTSFVGWTLDIECQGQVLVAGNKIGIADEVMPFVCIVLRWSSLRWGPPLKKLEMRREHTAKVISAASHYMQDGHLNRAMATISALDGVGPYTGAKILRMMFPQQAVAYSEPMDEYFTGYKRVSKTNADGYVEFRDDCKEVARFLSAHAHRKKSMQNPFRINGGWYAADVEAVIFQDMYENGLLD